MLTIISVLAGETKVYKINILRVLKSNHNIIRLQIIVNVAKLVQSFELIKQL